MQKIVKLLYPNLNFLHHQNPFKQLSGIYLAICAFDDFQTSESGEQHSPGLHLAEQLATKWLPNGSEFKVYRKESGQPYGRINSEEVGVSIAHSKSHLFAGINKFGNIGVDLEPVDRKVHSGLAARIRCANDIGCENLEVVRMWTIKEAALKWQGTGLRYPMKLVKIIRNSDDHFTINIENKSARLISLRYHEYWIAVATDDIR